MRRVSRHRPFGAVCLALYAASLAAAEAPKVRVAYAVEKHLETVGADGRAVTTLVAADRVDHGDILRYTITFRNDGAESLAPGIVAIANPIPATLGYLPGTAAGADTEISFSVDGGRTFGSPGSLRIVIDGAEAVAPVSAYTTIRWVLRGALPPGGQGQVWFDARLQ